MILVSPGLQAQWKSKSLRLSTDSFQLDTLVLLQGSTEVSGLNKVYAEGLDYRINYIHKAFINLRIEPQAELIIRYRALNFDFNKSYRNKDPRIIDPEFEQSRNPFLYSPGEELLYGKGESLKLNGSIMRGLNFGNSQNVVVNSNLNLQISGKLNNEIDVLAAVSDENNPIQPEGNTQQLQDFDKVFVQLGKNKTRVVVGDFLMQKPDEMYFLNYYKKSRGVQAETGVSFKNKADVKVGAELALSRGRFARNVINGIEGNQGPYRLNGANGELFIILVSGTESVYLDGEKLARGEQNDYTIDYNTGEIIFTPRRVITQYSRIIVEFQYSDRNYARTVYTVSAAYQTANVRVRAAYFSEQDDKEQPFQQTLNDAERKVLAEAGNNPLKAVVGGEAKVSSFSGSKILYRKIDTLGALGVYVFAPLAGTDTVFYEVKFSFVGNGKGNYVQATSGANGRVYAFVPPLAGVLQGNYEPVILLVAPVQKSMLNLGVDIARKEGLTFSVDVSRSYTDRNTFSTFDKQNNEGFGARLLLFTKQKLGAALELNSSLQYETVDRNFRYVERYRGVEFDRNWNRLLVNTSAGDTGYSEHILTAKTELSKNKSFNLGYQLSYYDRNNAFSGWQHFVSGRLSGRYGFMNATTELLTISDNSLQAFAAANSSRKITLNPGIFIKRHVLGITYGYEQSGFRNKVDSLLGGSFMYHQASTYLTNNDSGAFKYRMEVGMRKDFNPVGRDFAEATLAQTTSLGTEWTQRNFNRLNVNVTFRQFDLLQAGTPSLQPERTLLTRVEYDYSLLKRVLTANTYYQLGSGNELKRDFSFVEVPVGQGIYMWKDFNKDELKQLNEFLVAGFADRNLANYIKVYLPTNSLIRANTVQFNQTLNLNPSAAWNNKGGIRKFASRWSNQAALRLERKTQEDGTFSFINPFEFVFSDTILMSVNSQLRNTLFFNRSHPVFGCDYTVQDNQSKVLQTNGSDSRRKTEQSWNARWNTTAWWTVNLTFSYGERSFLSQYFSTQNYDYYYSEWKPRITYQVNNNFRISLNVSHFEGFNMKMYGGERGTVDELGTELRYSFANAGVFTARYSLYQVEFTGEASSNLGYEMLQGFLIGENHLWSANLMQRIGQNLQLSFAYDGRQSAQNEILHTGKMEARYIF